MRRLRIAIMEECTMFRRACCVVVLLSLAGSLPSGQGTVPESDEIVQLERGALDRWGAGDPGGFLELYAPNVTYFDPMREHRIDGLEAMKQILEPIRGMVKVSRYEMIAPQVYRSGDVAVLSYNLVSYGVGPDGKPITTRWNSSTVYGRIDGRWKIVHSHFSITKSM
jgi:ketosteroid isomerase-like protein